jgi:hypothetical protein
MTSNSRESSPAMPNEISFGIDPEAPLIFGSLEEFLRGLDDELSKIPEEKPNIYTKIPPQNQLPNNKDKKFELVQSGSFLDFFLGGFNAKKNLNQAPLKDPPIPLDMLKANHQHNQNPFLDFLGKCIPKEKPSNNPSKARSDNLSGLPQSARYC